MENKNFNFEKIQDLKYGENSHQSAALFLEIGQIKADYEVLCGSELSYNNILDMTTALNIISEFFDVPAVAIVKNSNPCGVALGKDIFDAYTKALDCDPISSIGGIFAFTEKVDEKTANQLKSMDIKFLIAPDYDKNALQLLQTKKDLKIIKINTSLDDYKKIVTEEVKITPFGTLFQTIDQKELDKETFKVVTKTKPTAEQIEDAIFAWKVAKHAKSNAIVVAKDFKTLAIGQKHTSRICSAECALDFACDNSKDSILASDCFLSETENIYAAAQGRIALIIQPGGSDKDPEIIKTCDKYKIAMITTGISHFKN